MQAHLHAQHNRQAHLVDRTLKAEGKPYVGLYQVLQYGFFRFNIHHFLG